MGGKKVTLLSERTCDQFLRKEDREQAGRGNFNGCFFLLFCLAVPTPKISAKPSGIRIQVNQRISGAMCTTFFHCVQ